MTKLLIITRDHLPQHNGLTDHTALVIHCLQDKFERVDVVCEKSALRPKNYCPTDHRIFEFKGMGEFFPTVSKAMSDGGYDVVLFQYVPHMWGRAGVAPIASIIPLWLRWKFKIPVVSFLHELYYDWSTNLKRLSIGLIHRTQLMVIASTSTANIVTNFKRQTAMQRLWKQKVFRVPAGNVSARKDDDKRMVRYSWPYITWYGTLGDDQNVEDLVQAFCKVAETHPTLHLVLVGGFNVSSPRIKSIHVMATEMGIGDRIVVLGFTHDNDLSDILSGSVFNVIVYSNGPSGRRGVVAACLRSGRALIAIDGKETDPEFLHNQNLLLVAPRDIPALSKAMDKMCTDTELRKRLESGAQGLFRQYFSDDTVSRKLDEVLAQCPR